MKKIYYSIVLCSLFFACSVENDEPQVEEGLVRTLDVQSTKVNDADLCNQAIFVDLCTSDVKNPNLRGFSNFYDAQIQLHTDLPLTGTYSPSMAELVEQYHETGGIGVFNTTYSVNTDDCGTATAEISVKIANCQVQDPGCATENIAVEICSSDVKNPNAHGFRNFYDAQVQLHSDLPLTGSFSPTMAELVAQYEEAGGIGTFTSNYSVSTDDCGVVTTEVAVTVRNCQSQDPACDVSDIAVEICSSEVKNPNVRGFRNFFDAQVQLHSDLPLTGTFSPTMAELVEQYEQAGGVGTFTSNYSVVTENCGEVTIEVATTIKNCQSQDPVCDVSDIAVSICSSDVTNPTERGFRNFYDAQVQLHSDLPLTGSYSPTMAELVKQYEQSGGLGTFSTNYTVWTDDCGEVTIQVSAQVNECE